MDGGVGVWELVPLDDGVALAVLDGEAPTLSDAVGVRELAWLSEPVGVVDPVVVALAVARGVSVGVLLLVRVGVSDGPRYSLRTRGPSSSSTDMPSPARAICLGATSRALVAGLPSPAHCDGPFTQLPTAGVSQPEPLTSRRTHDAPPSAMSRSPFPSSANPTGLEIFIAKALLSRLLSRGDVNPVPATVLREYVEPATMRRRTLYAFVSATYTYPVDRSNWTAYG